MTPRASRCGVFHYDSSGSITRSAFTFAPAALVAPGLPGLARLDLENVSQWCKLNPMAAVDIERILKEAKALPESDRARLAQELVATLDGPADADAAAAWDRELEKRLSDLRSGNAELLSREEFTRRLG
jgi:putative addiction module component (TIGR02574 family)